MLTAIYLLCGNHAEKGEDPQMFDSPEVWEDGCILCAALGVWARLEPRSCINLKFGTLDYLRKSF